MYKINNILTEKDATLISPKLAGEILQKQKDLEFNGSTITQRDIDQKKVDVFVNDIKNGNWGFTGDSIKLANNGRLLDGQHRLTAILKSGVSVPMLVVNSMNESNFTKMDIGKPRNLRDFLKIAKIPYYVMASAILINITKSVSLSANHDFLKTPDQYLNLYYQNTSLIKYILGIYNKKYALGRDNIIIQLLALFHNTKYQTIAEEHIHQIYNNVVSETNSNIFLLRNHINKIKKEAEKNKIRIDRREYKKLFIASIYKTGNLQKYNAKEDYSFTIKQIMPERYEQLINMLNKAKETK